MSADSEPWRFLEETPDPCAVIGADMKLVYLNGPARSLVGPDWFGKPCWEVFPVADQNCAASCPAVRAISGGCQISYCEEKICAADKPPSHLAVAIVPLPAARDQNPGAILLMRPKPGDEETQFRSRLMDDARKLRKSSPLEG